MNDLMEMQNDSEQSITKLTTQIEQLKGLNLLTVAKCEELKKQIITLKKIHAQELRDKVAKAEGRSSEVEAEIQVLKEMIKSVKM